MATKGVPDPKIRPLIEVGDESEWMEREKTLAQNPGAFGTRGDGSFVPGYSDVRAEREDGKRRGVKVQAPRWRCQWVRVLKPNSREVDMSETHNFLADGYFPVKASQLEAMGLGMPPAGRVNAEGHIVWKDTMLYACSAKQAQVNEQDWRRATDEAAANREAAIHAEGGITVDQLEQTEELRA